MPSDFIANHENITSFHGQIMTNAPLFYCQTTKNIPLFMVKSWSMPRYFRFNAWLLAAWSSHYQCTIVSSQIMSICPVPHRTRVPHPCRYEHFNFSGKLFQGHIQHNLVLILDVLASVKVCFKFMILCLGLV